MASFRRAREEGSPGLELDIHVCASGELVVVHDDTFARTAFDSRAVADLSLDEIRRIDAGSSFGPAFSSEHPPLLEEVLEEFCPALYIDIELKTRKVRDDPLPALAAEKLKALGERALGSVTVSSFNPFALLAFRKRCSSVPTAIIWCRDADVPFILRYGFGRHVSCCDYLKPEHVLVNRFSGFRFTVLEGRPFVPWTVSDPLVRERVLALGSAGTIG
jgi:glycerophosphoryl diester phosphodiesterase